MMLWKKRRKKNLGMRVAARQRKIKRVFEEEERESRRGHGGQRTTMEAKEHGGEGDENEQFRL